MRAIRSRSPARRIIASTCLGGSALATRWYLGSLARSASFRPPGCFGGRAREHVTTGRDGNDQRPCDLRECSDSFGQAENLPFAGLPVHPTEENAQRPRRRDTPTLLCTPAARKR